MTQRIANLRFITLFLTGILTWMSLTAANGGMTVNRYEPDSTRVLHNPLNGWVMYMGRNWDENFWTEKGYDSMKAAGETSPVRVSDYASCAYMRTSWVSFEPEEGKYIWNDPDSRLMKLIQSVLDRGLKIAFRIVIDGRDQGQNTPQYVFDAGAEGYYDPKNPGSNLSPYPDDPVFQEKYAKFLHAFAKEFDDPEKFEFIDAYSLGKWGESHSMIYKDNRNKRKVFDWVMNLAEDCFKRVPMVIHYHRMLGDPADDGWGSVPADAEELITIAADHGFSLRHDAFGMTGYYQEWEKEMARKWNFRRPIIMEGGWITGAHHRYWRDPSGKYREGHAEDVRRGEYEASAEARVNMMDLRINDETRSWFEEAFPLVKKFVAEGGYRLYPDMVSTPAKAKKGQSVKVTSRWNNMGWGYCPTNLPQWNQKFKVGIALLDNDGNPVKVTVDTASDLSKWLRENATECVTQIDLSDVKKGQYTWAVALVDTTKGNRPGLEIAVDRARLVNGWLPAGKITVK